jgi:hypothetical protein
MLYFIHYYQETSGPCLGCLPFELNFGITWLWLEKFPDESAL